MTNTKASLKHWDTKTVMDVLEAVCISQCFSTNFTFDMQSTLQHIRGEVEIHIICFFQNIIHRYLK